MQDFPSRLSPMLVKELRQGMRTNLFSTAFILLQAVMVLSLLAGLADPSAMAANGFFWFFIVVTLLVVQPLRGFNALSSEYDLNTMDLIQLTRLDAWRITLGKWTALNAQTLLFLTGVLPYLVMRYFLGNVNFVADLVALLYLGLGSALASAITVGCSAFRHIVLRGMLVLGFGFGLFSLFTMMQAMIFRSSFAGADRFATMGLAALAMLYGCFFFLSFGASRIAPLSENHATRKRLVALAFAALCLGFARVGSEEAAVIVVALILGFACIDALTEPLPVFARVLAPFRRNAPLRLAACFFAPGWLSGIAFFLLCVGIWTSAAGLISSSSLPKSVPSTALTSLLSMANLFLFPLIPIHLLFPRHASGSFTFGIYAFLQACLAALTIMVAVLAAALPRHDDLVHAIVPIPSVLLAAVENGGASRTFELVYFAAAVLTFALGIAVPLMRQREALRDFARHLKPA